MAAKAMDCRKGKLYPCIIVVILLTLFRERQSWRCAHCWVWGTAVWAVRDGPKGPRTLCNNCGYLYERDKKLPPWSENLFMNDRPTHDIPRTYQPR